jgi:L-ascorbate metabolism protein UlaG (beta-lactamase superfamily)
MATLRLLRHATLLLDLGGTTFLVDPMLAAAGSLPPVPGTPNQVPNPLVELPLPSAEVVAAADAVLVTHLHRDHLDDAAAAAIAAAGLPVLCQPGDGATLRETHGLSDVAEVAPAATHAGVEIHRTGGRHGHGELAERMGRVSGFVLRAPGEPSVHIAGDTVWCDEVAAALAEHRPAVVVVNAGAATFTGEPPITMDADDVLRVAEAAPDALVVAVHLEAFNHCVLSRDALRAAIGRRRIAVPDDGETVALA